MTRYGSWSMAFIAVIIVGCTEQHVTTPSHDHAEHDISALSFCAVAYRTGTAHVSTARIPLNDMPFVLADETRDDSTSRSSYHVVSAQQTWTAAQGATEFGIACIAPASVSMDSFSDLVHEISENSLRELLGRGVPTRSESLPVALIASNTLMKPLLDPIRHTRVSTKHGNVDDPAVGASCCIYRLPAIEVIAYSSAWLINLSDLYWFFHAHTRWGNSTQMYTVDTYYNDLCPAASEKYLSEYEKLQELEADSAAYHNIASQVMHYLCEPRADGKTKCIDLFIASERTFVVGYGDNRTFDGNAKYKASRVQMYIDFDNLSGVAYINHSTVGWGPFEITEDPYPHQPKHFRAWRRPDGAVVVEFQFYNAFCKYADKDICPAIDGYIEFTQQSDGSWRHSQILRDDYPSIAIYEQQPDGTFLEEYRDAEGHWTALWTRGRTLEKWREQMQLPPGCNMQ